MLFKYFKYLKSRLHHKQEKHYGKAHEGPEHHMFESFMLLAATIEGILDIKQ